MIFALAETIYVMNGLKWRIAIWIRTFPICLRDYFAFFVDGDIAGSFTDDTFSICCDIARLNLASVY